MFQLILKKFKSDAKQMILKIVELAVVFLLVNAVMISIVDDWNLQNFYQGEDDLYYLSGGLGQLKSGEKTKDRIKKIENIAGVEAVGWEEQFEAAIGKTDNGKIMTGIYFSPEMKNARCRLLKGKWFDNEEENQVIVGKNGWMSNYQVGEKIIVNGVSCTVIGIMDGYAKFISMNHGMIREFNKIDERIPNTEEVTKNAADYILTNSKNLIKKDTLRVKLSSVLVRLDEKNSTVKQSLKNYGCLFQIKSMLAQNKEKNKMNFKKDFFYRLFLLVAVFSAFEIIKDISLKEEEDIFDIYKICGLSQKQYIKMKILSMLFVLIIAWFLFLCFYYSDYFYTQIFKRVKMSGWIGVSTFGISFLFLFGSLVWKRKK